MQQEENSKLNYMVQLDALRALAVFGVMIEHFVPDNHPLKAILPWGRLGVKLFFVLSGFLITSILLRCRYLSESRKQDTRLILRQFYIRRFLRIFPIYYLIVAITAIINIGSAREALFWNLTYTSNIYFLLKGEWQGAISHFWSLSVEEQFYLVWPWIILFVPYKHLLKTIFLVIAIEPLFRLLCIGINLNTMVVELLPFSYLVCLGMGAILAFYSQKDTRIEQHRSNLCKLCLWVSIPLFAMLQIRRLFPVSELSHASVVEDTVTAMLFTGLIGFAAQGFSGAIGTILELKPLRYLGKISYGIYVYHNFIYIIILYPSLFRILGLPYPNSDLVQFFYKVVATLIIATLSWYFFEKPINGLKHLFEYNKTDEVKQAL